MNRKLTARQKAFLDKLLDLYHEHKGPVHYSAVAERLGVNRFSAYDMLRVLEKKGFAASSYALRSATAAASPAGPGRSMVVFAPTAQAIVQRQGDHLPDEWPGVREQVLNKLRSARESSYREALNDLLAALPEAAAPLTFCTEMIGVLLLNMKRVGARAGGLSPFRVLAALRTDQTAGLETLPALSVGAALSADNDDSNLSLLQRLLDQARRYQADLAYLSEDARLALLQFLEEALEALD